MVLRYLLWSALHRLFFYRKPTSTKRKGLTLDSYTNNELWTFTKTLEKKSISYPDIRSAEIVNEECSRISLSRNYHKCGSIQENKNDIACS